MKKAYTIDKGELIDLISMKLAGDEGDILRSRKDRVTIAFADTGYKMTDNDSITISVDV